jgi:hypothetical protein
MARDNQAVSTGRKVEKQHASMNAKMTQKVVKKLKHEIKNGDVTNQKPTSNNHNGGSFLKEKLGYSSEKIAKCLMDDFNKGNKLKLPRLLASRTCEKFNVRYTRPGSRFSELERASTTPSPVPSTSALQRLPTRGGSEPNSEISYKIRTKINEQVQADMYDVVITLLKLRCSLFQQMVTRHGETVENEPERGLASEDGETRDNYYNYNNSIICDKKEIPLTENTAHNLFTTLLQKIMGLKILKDNRKLNERNKATYKTAITNRSNDHKIQKKAAYLADPDIQKARRVVTNSNTKVAKAEKDVAKAEKDVANAQNAQATSELNQYKLVIKNIPDRTKPPDMEKEIYDALKQVKKEIDKVKNIEDLKNRISAILNPIKNSAPPVPVDLNKMLAIPKPVPRGMGSPYDLRKN